MKRTNLRRAVSGVLSVAMTASALFSDFSVPASVYASDDTSSVETSLDGYSESDGSITSEYIVENLDEDLGEEAAALNEDAAYMVAEEYLVSELTEVSEDTGTVSDISDETTVDVETTDTETVTDNALTESIGASSNDADVVSTSSNDVGTANLSLDDETVSATTEETTTDTEETTEVTVSEEEVAEVAEVIIDTSEDITTAEDYDTNGLAATYHYIVLNYSLVDEDYVWDGMTIDDLWNDVPDAFIASYLTYVNVYTLEDNEDYYVAMIDPAALNGLGSAIYADFTNLDTDNPVIYNDIITFDTETGLVYIPKSFYYDEEGNETLKDLEAQVLVPYSFDSTYSDVSVSVTSEIDGVEGMSGTSSVPTLDVTMTIQIVDVEDADKISLDDISLAVNDDILPYDTTESNAYYDTETGELTISASPNSIYSVNVTIAENEAGTALAMMEQREILVASTGDLSDILVADSYYDGVEAVKADNAAGMNSLTSKGVTVEITDGTPAAGQTITYTAPWYVDTTEQTTVSTTDIGKIIANTAEYTYYAQTSGGSAREVSDTTWSQFFDSNGNVSLSSSTDAQYLLRALSNTQMSSTYNRIVGLPDGEELTSTSYNGSGTCTTSWTTNISGNPTGYETYVAMHCVHNSQSAATGAVEGRSAVTMRILYAYEDSNGDGYFVFSLNIPKSYQQSGSSVYKVNYSTKDNTEYNAKFGIKKVSSEDNTEQLDATFIYKVFSESASDYIVQMTLGMFTSYAEMLETGKVTETSFKKGMESDPTTGMYYSSTSGVSIKSLTESNCSILEDYSDGDGNILIAIGEISAPDDYERREGMWILEVTPGRIVDGVTQSSSKLVSVTYYYKDENNTVQSYSEKIVSGSYTTFIAEDEPSTTEYTVTKKFSNTLTSSLVKSVTVELYADGTDTGKSATLQSSNSWSYTWTGLDKSSNGTDIEYTVEETGVVMYDQYNSATTYTVSSSSVDKVFAVSTTTADGSSTITNKINTTELDVEKTFGNNDTEDRISEVVVTLYRNNVSTGQTLTLNDANDWSGTFSNLVKYDASGTAYTYKAVETSVTYTDMWGKSHTVDDRNIITTVFTVSETTSSNKTTVKNTIKTTSHTVKKVMGSDTTEDVVNSVTIRLYADNTSLSSVFGDITLSDSNSWSDKWTGLDLCDYQGNKISYTAEEISVDVEDPYTATVSTVSSSNLKTVFTVNTTTANGTTTTTNTVQTRPLYVEKTFGNNDTEDRISEVVVTLYRNNVSTGVTLTLNEANNWSGTFENLLTYDTSGNEYSYKAVETSVTYTDMWDKEHKVTSRSIITKLFTVTEITSGETTTITNTFNTVDHDVSKDLMFVLFDVETETEDGVTTIKNTYKTTEYTVRASMKRIWTDFG